MCLISLAADQDSLWIDTVIDQSTINRSHWTRTCSPTSTRSHRTRNHSVLWSTHLHQSKVNEPRITPYRDRLIYVRSKSPDQERLNTELDRSTPDQDSLQGNYACFTGFGHPKVPALTGVAEALAKILILRACPRNPDQELWSVLTQRYQHG